jgi:hypothetical protein
MRIVGGWMLGLCSLWLLAASAAGGQIGQANPESRNRPPRPADAGMATQSIVFEGVVFDDRDGDGLHGRKEPGLAGVGVSDGRRLVRSDGQGRYRLQTEPGRTMFAIKPAGWRFAERADGLPAFWVHVPDPHAPRPKFGGIVQAAPSRRFDLALRREAPRTGGLNAWVFGDPQVKSMADVGYYARDIIDSARDESRIARGAQARTDLGLSLGDIADDELSLYPALNAETRRLGVPWLHAAGNHDLDFDVGRDEDSLLSFRNVYGPDTFAWEEPEATFVVLDDVIYRPGRTPAYIGGFREDQFAYLETYLASARKERLLVLAMHIPLFEPEGRDTFRDADRERLFALLEPFPNVLVLSAHSHTQQHYFHGASTGWRGATPLHEYNVGATCGGYWSGVKDARGVPDATMADGTPNGYAKLHVAEDGGYRLSWRVAGLGAPSAAPGDSDGGARHSIGLHAPRALRRGAYPAWAVYANVYMGHERSRVEYRIDDGEWKPMTRVLRPDPRLLIENVRDDAAEALRGYDRSPEAEPSKHLWRGALPTGLVVGAHRIEVRVFDTWQGEQRARIEYRLIDAEK